MCSEINSPSVTSPRISFSHDIRNDDDAVGVQKVEEDDDDDDDQAETEASGVDIANANEFDFSFNDGFLNESSSADELFSEGLIRPIQLQDKLNDVSKHGTSSSPEELFMDSLKWPLQPQEKINVSKQTTLSFHDEFVVEKSSSVDELFPDGLIRPLKPQEKIKVSTSECLKQHYLLSSKESSIVSSVIETEHKHQSKSFWRIHRSSSVHCVDNTKKSSFWSLPLMSRSNSTGSVPSGAQIVKENKRQISHKHAKNLSNSSSFYMYQFSQKPPLKKNYGGCYGSGAWANPALNAPPPYIAKGTANLFGLTSLFKDKKDKKTKK